MRVSTRVTRNADTASAASTAADEFMMDAATVGFDRSQEIVADEATDTGQLLQSGFPPERLRDGSVQWGYSAGYARPVDEGQSPHWPPIKPLLGWARRVLGDESAAYPVQAKIAEEGTDPVDFTGRAVEKMRAWTSARSMGDYLVERM